MAAVAGRCVSLYTNVYIRMWKDMIAYLYTHSVGLSMEVLIHKTKTAH